MVAAVLYCFQLDVTKVAVLWEKLERQENCQNYNSLEQFFSMAEIRMMHFRASVLIEVVHRLIKCCSN